MITRPSVLVAGCSEGSLGSVLALAFQATGQYQVFATARNEKELTALHAAGVETLALDAFAKDYVQACVDRVDELTGGSLDILINNITSTQYSTSTAAASASDKAKQALDPSLWATACTTQAFLQLLMSSEQGGTIVNHFSAQSPSNSPSAASEYASAASLTLALRSALSPLGVQVIELTSGDHLKSASYYDKITRASMYWPPLLIVEYVLGGHWLDDQSDIPADQVWADKVVKALSSNELADTLSIDGRPTTDWSAALSVPADLLRSVIESAAQFADIKSSFVRYGMEKSIANSCGTF